MRKQSIQFLVIVIVLILCAGGYFAASKYFSKQEEKEKENAIVAFEMEDYKNNITSISYTNESKTITLLKQDNKWHSKDDKSINLDNSAIESNMLAPLSKVEASQKLDKPDNLSDYGFTTDKNGSIEPSTNKLVIVDGDNKTYTLYIGDSNPYDSSQYYFMIEGDDNVYVIDNTLADGFAKSIDDITEEESTVEETSQTLSETVT